MDGSAFGYRKPLHFTDGLILVARQEQVLSVVSLVENT